MEDVEGMISVFMELVSFFSQRGKENKNQNKRELKLSVRLLRISTVFVCYIRRLRRKQTKEKKSYSKRSSPPPPNSSSEPESFQEFGLWCQDV